MKRNNVRLLVTGLAFALGTIVSIKGPSTHIELKKVDTSASAQVQTVQRTSNAYASLKNEAPDSLFSLLGSSAAAEQVGCNQNDRTDNTCCVLNGHVCCCSNGGCYCYR